jgi:formate dehydrogenase subunit gamma
MGINTQTKRQVRQPVNSKKVLRFTKGERISHWVHAIAFFLLLFTGLGIFNTSFQPLMTIFGGIQIARLIHRGAAIVFVVIVGLMFVVGNPSQHWEWLKSVFKFSKEDWQHVRAFPKEFFGGHGDYPPQDKYNGGEKINSLITIFGSFFITVSGTVMWMAPWLPPELVRWAYPVHDLSMFMMAAAALGHIYLGILHPDSRAALPGMLNGYVSTNFARSHHAKWYERVQKEQKIS